MQADCASDRMGKKLFTPGPLSCSTQVKAAMMHDLGSRDQEFIDCVREVRASLLDIAKVSEDEYTAVPLQGSGTYCVEAVLQTTSPRDNARVLVLTNGAYGERMVKACQYAGIEVRGEDYIESLPIPVPEIQRLLEGEGAWTTVAMVHCETSSGVINPVEEVGRLVRRYAPGAAFVVDAMSSFGAVPLDLEAAGVDYLVSSANKCLEGVPGFSYAICRLQHLLSCRGQCRVLSLDLVAQHLALHHNGQFRFTPPTHALLAFRAALRQHREEGGVQGRAARYLKNQRVLVEGMEGLGYRRLLHPRHASYIITAFLYPQHPNFDFTTFYTKLADRGQVIYPGKVTRAPCFRVGTIGHLFPEDVRDLLTSVQAVMRDMGLPAPLT
ncbi:2-aminoethylphosphonate--pyruvate transaminase [Chionoecetes opilio]|uniref:Alanine--glyoxylate aminotransferase n=1 Tax=Chionoecetes opilio TaxID=41210 RepID=A0A8J5C060_CHIOP|nr:2-aminoethylphosphonate--pyruvate transaminase [Chionoecetes opilio]